MVEPQHVRAVQLDGAGQKPGFFETRIVNGHHGEGLVLYRWFEVVQHQIIPKLSSEFKTVMMPGLHPIGSRCLNLHAIVGARKRTDDFAIFGWTPSLVLGQEIATRCEVSG